MTLISVDEALARLLRGVAPLETEAVALENANGRCLAQDIRARRTQPPFSASAMDGYAVRAADIATVPVRLRVIGEAPAGHGFAGEIGPFEAVRIFTGAPLPRGADTILIQENAEPTGGDGSITALETADTGRYVRPAGLDFREGDVLLQAGCRLGFSELALAAGMNHATLPVVRRPRVAILATGDELVPPGANSGPDQIIASNHIGVGAIVEDNGGLPIHLGIAEDRPDALARKIAAARECRADVLVTLGGASVGDHDLVQEALGNAGMHLAFWRIAMRPGKPLMAGRIGSMQVLGLPGNPVSSLVCSLLFLKPLLAALSGLQAPARLTERVPLAAPVGENDRREDYLRARLEIEGDGTERVKPFDKQDSSMLTTLASANALIVRPPHGPALPSGTPVPVIRISGR
ncbi:gephyrin-like molybdotransferase Glp [Stappia sp. ES.058]|uniref:molybdopterin molybdotransferase MoeA n=1 Tax=Stappia sp. ES.058 TaxID=1881061 RepID=UPI000879ECA9|nr:gephyrin-like molybdotransferase Glp [Stappia sp. ES.058]SDU11388.1 molybdopterin molybdotransferase [Stappia sp. ES.058]